MRIFTVVQENTCPVLVPDTHMHMGGSKSNSLVRITNWYWPTMATVGISISRKPERRTRDSAIVSRNDTSLARVSCGWEAVSQAQYAVSMALRNWATVAE